MHEQVFYSLLLWDNLKDLTMHPVLLGFHSLPGYLSYFSVRVKDKCLRCHMLQDHAEKQSEDSNHYDHIRSHYGLSDGALRATSCN